MDDNYIYDPARIVYFAATDARNNQVPFGIRAEDRMRHMYVIGKTGMGKSTLLENLAIQDIQNGEGICFIDPHGETAEKLLEYVPESRIKDVVYFAPFDVENPVGFNVMEDVGYDKRHLVVAGLMSSFKRIWVDMWSARMEYILQNVLLALLEYPDTTLIDINRMLINKEFRKKVVEYVTDPIVKRFWVEEFAGYGDRYTQEATPAIQNKVGQFASNPLVRNIIAQPKSTFDIREIMDTRKIFIVNLSKGRMGEQNADLLGSMLTTKIYLSAMSRAEETAEGLNKLPPFYLYVDEFQSVVNDSFANILSEARKYKLSLTIAHQYIEQVDEEIQAAVFGNVGTTITFRVGPFDAEKLKTIFEPTFFVEDIVNLGFAQIYLSLMIDGIGSKPFSASTLPSVDSPPKSFVKEIIERSRKTYGRSRSSVEDIIRKQDEKLPPGGFEKPASKWPKKKKNTNITPSPVSTTIQNGSKDVVQAQPKTDYKKSSNHSAVIKQNVEKESERVLAATSTVEKKPHISQTHQNNNNRDTEVVKKTMQPKKEVNDRSDLRSALAAIVRPDKESKKESNKEVKVQNKEVQPTPPERTGQKRHNGQSKKHFGDQRKENNTEAAGPQVNSGTGTQDTQNTTKEVPREVLDKLLKTEE